MLKGLLTFGLLAVALTPLTANAAGPLDGRCLSRITVDSRELRDKGGVGAADILDKRLPQQLREAFADRFGCRGGLTLVVRLQTISLPIAGSGSSVFGGVPMDSLKGESLLVSGRQTIATYPLTARASADIAGYLDPGYSPEVRLRRLQNLAEAFAGWLRVHYVGS